MDVTSDFTPVNPGYGPPILDCKLFAHAI